MTKIAQAAVLLVLLSGCATNSGFKYIEPSRKDVLTEPTARQIIEHNRFCDKQANCVKPYAGD